MIAVLDGFYSWRGGDETLSGLARCQNGEWAFVYQPERGWAVKSELFGLLLNGDMAFEKIDHAAAAGLASQYGVELDAPAEWLWDPKKLTVVSLKDGSAPSSQLVAAATSSDEPVEERVWLMGPTETAHVKKALGR